MFAGISLIPWGKKKYTWSQIILPCSMYPAPINLGKDFMDGDRKYSRVVINSMMAAARTLLNWSNFLPQLYHHRDHLSYHQFKVFYIIFFHVLKSSVIPKQSMFVYSIWTPCRHFPNRYIPVNVTVFFITMVVIITIIRKLRWSPWFPWCSMWSVWWDWRHSVMGRFHHCHKNNPCTSHHLHHCHKNNPCTSQHLHVSHDYLHVPPLIFIIFF